jgi:hypothetical protein
MKVAVQTMLAPIARARLNRASFAVPVELWALKSMSRLKNALGLQAVRTHVTQS